MREQAEAVQRMQDYIEQHLCEMITLADLSGVSFFLRGIPTGFLRNLRM